MPAATRANATHAPNFAATDPVLAAIEKHAAQATVRTNCLTHFKSRAAVTPNCAALKAARDALLAWLTTPPATLAGVIALLDHVGLPAFPDEEGSIGHDTILHHAGLCCRQDICDAAAEFLPMIADALRELLAV